MDNQPGVPHDPVSEEHISNTSLPPDWRSNARATLSNACLAGDLGTVRYIFSEITEGPALDDIKEHFSGPLIWACTGGYPDILTCLLENGAPIDDCVTFLASNDKDADTIIRIFEILLEYGVSLKDYPGVAHTWLHNEKVLEYLLCNGADPNGLDDYDDVPLNTCSMESSIKLLVDFGADLSLANQLQHAVCFPNETYSADYCEFLLSIGVDINARAVHAGQPSPGSKQYKDKIRNTCDGGTALHFLARGYGRRGRPEVDPIPRMKWLLEHGADVDVKDNSGKTPLDFATEEPMIELLKSYQG